MSTTPTTPQATAPTVPTGPAGPTPATALRVHSVGAEEGLIWALTDGRDRLVGSAGVALREPLNAADTPTADLELWVAPGADVGSRWAALVPVVLDGLRLLEIGRVETRCDPANGERLAFLAASGFRVTGAGGDGTLRLVAERP